CFPVAARHRGLSRRRLRRASIRSCSGRQSSPRDGIDHSLSLSWAVCFGRLTGSSVKLYYRHPSGSTARIDSLLVLAIIRSLLESPYAPCRSDATRRLACSVYPWIECLLLPHPDLGCGEWLEIAYHRHCPAWIHRWSRVSGDSQTAVVASASGVYGFDVTTGTLKWQLHSGAVFATFSVEA